MSYKIYSAAMQGVLAGLVEVEADVAAGIPFFELTGNLSTTAKEGRERIRIAIKNSKYHINPSRITINLIPANMRKDGPHYDLAMALSLLTVTGYVSLKEDIFCAGELSLDGRVNEVNAILPMVLCARDRGVGICIIPKANIEEASIVSGIKIIGVESLRQCVDILNGTEEINNASNIKPVKKEITENDFSGLKGQKAAKRAVLIAASSMHNILLIGPPGSGKSAIASCIPGIMPDLDYNEMIRVMAVYSIAGRYKDRIDNMYMRPFRAPHHSTTVSGMMGGGYNPMPGEVSLSDKGILYLDEFNLFDSRTIDSLRIPLEQHTISISRNYGTLEYPADFMLVAAMNPCRCGYYPDMSKCNCSDNDIRHYFGRISKPVMDRIDMSIQVSKSTYDEIRNVNDDEMSSRDMKKIVARTFEIQKERYKGCEFFLNSRLKSDMIDKFCRLSPDANQLLKFAYDRYDMSARSYYRIIKVARTIADVEECEIIEESHIYEALGYRMV